jgi:hypothetical protein
VTGFRVERDKDGADGTVTITGLGAQEGMFGDNYRVAAPESFGAIPYAAATDVVEALVSGGSDAAFAVLAELYRSWLVERPEIERSAA